MSAVLRGVRLHVSIDKTQLTMLERICSGLCCFVVYQTEDHRQKLFMRHHCRSCCLLTENPGFRWVFAQHCSIMPRRFSYGGVGCCAILL